ncbi:MAG: stage II sporulation protein M [Nanoarchaeota archaeon]
MLEDIIHPKRTQKGPWKMFFIGLIYASLSLVLVHWFFSQDPDLSKASGMMVVLFSIMFTLPYMYFIIRKEEKEDETVEGFKGVWNAHKDALYAFMWLFLGFVIAFSFWYIALQDENLLNFQLQTYCRINNPGDINACVEQYVMGSDKISGSILKETRLLSIIENNIYVMIFTLIFSLIFGAGAIFILIWNASVIAAAIGIFTKYSLAEIPLGIGRYMIHGLPEIAAYFVAALAGGIFGVGVLRHGIKDERFYKVLQHSIILLFIAILLILIGGIIEVYFTPVLFS